MDSCLARLPTFSRLVLRASLVALALAPLSAFAQRFTDPDYVAGREAWAARNWSSASAHLSRFFGNGTDHATYDVDFWLGTSWCRLPGEESPGADLLDWSLSFARMPEAARPVFAAELRRCVVWITEANQARSIPAALLVVANGGSTATVRATGKTYAIGSGKGGLSAYPVRVKRPMSQEALDARLVLRTDPDRAESLTAARVPGFLIAHSTFFVLASQSPQLSAADLATVGKRLDDFVAFLGRVYALPPPATFITVYLFPDIPKLRAAADSLHGLDASPATLGYSFENDLSILAFESTTAVGTLLHEVFHIIVHGSYASIPQWLDEGMASLYETATAVPGYYFGEPNWRSEVFQELRYGFGNITLAEVITSPWFADEPNAAHPPGERVYTPDEQAYMLAYARLFTLYLQQKTQLIPVFEAFRLRKPPTTYVPAKTQAIALLETALGKPVADIQADFLAWVPMAYDPRRRFYAGGSIPRELPRSTSSAVAAIEKELPNLPIDPAGPQQSIDRSDGR